MLQKKRLLIVAQDMLPYSDISETIGRITEQLPHVAQSSGLEVRILMPKFGIVNERRHRLHEVVRLSGMNIIVDDDDYSLIIKVASLPGSRMQVYFLDNTQFFKGREIFENEDGSPLADNADRMAFFCKGVLEIVKKFGWSPDLIHCHGWMTSLIPFYIKTAYKNEPLFRDSKIVASLYDETYDKHFTDRFHQKASINHLTEKDLTAFDGENGVYLHGGIAKYADGLIIGEENMIDEVTELGEKHDKPVLSFEADEYDALQAYTEFYNTLLSK